ncbi:hypothetical protein [Streptomyces xanthophaeus]|uniref:Uncharacterized protein n=1 Tax=Streptomyces xanthophaeus TaxID=67385 RepID=A0A919H3X7_9ACTN|nr:hypothetical protein [Streptomyces xanthophaeus]WST22215.1 hypothetical protein OG264_12385 [Streptomyces xanthophaeus]WST62810.1 hypothetical protein OG605_26050 [Streptomyces xanthophaeus]GHI89997.1 hypothetical protein Sxan_73610 [Streptomyces xanthophaeus]
MGGWEHTQGGRRGRPAARRAVLLMAFGVLAGALFLCARPGGSHAAATAAPGHDAHVVCLAPYELPGCSGLSHVTPGVLPVPPPAVDFVRTGPVPDARPSRTTRPRPAGTLARAPDLHALQVLRT